MRIQFGLAVVFVLAASVGAFAQLDGSALESGAKALVDRLSEPLSESATQSAAATPLEAPSATLPEPGASTAVEEVPPPIPEPQVAPEMASPEPAAMPAAGSYPPANGQEMRAWDFGVSYVSTGAGLKVKGVIVGSPAAAMGVKPNDVIVSVNDAMITSGNALDAAQINSVSVVRNGQAMNLTPGSHSVQRPATPQQATYSVPRTTYSAPQRYRYAPSYNYQRAPAVTYRTAPRTTYYRSPGYSAYRYSAGPRISVGFGVSNGIGYGRGYPGRYGGFGPGYGYGRGIGPGFGPGFGPSFGRSGVGISIGGIGIRF